MNYESHKNYSGCTELYNFLCINVGLTSIPVLTCSCIYEINFLYFGGLVYLIYRDIMLINRCYNKYENSYYFNYFIASSSVLIFNELIYLIKFSLLIRTSYFSRKIKNSKNKKDDDDKKPIISNTNNYNLNDTGKYFSNGFKNKRVRFNAINSVDDERYSLLNSNNTDSSNCNLYDTINEINEPNNMYE